MSREEDVPADVLEKEREIQRDRALSEGKPEKMVDKIAEGRMSKFYEEVCLLEQPFISENTISVAELIKTVGTNSATTSRSPASSASKWATRAMLPALRKARCQ